MNMYSADTTTGIYCRPGCGAPASTQNERFFSTAAGAETAGFRACSDCRPYRTAFTVGADAPELVCRAVHLIIDGALDTGTEADLAGRIGMSSRHLRRIFFKHLGATPDQLARSRRVHFARRLLDDTNLTVADVAFASGFGSLRQFNRMMQEVFGASPTELRNRRHCSDRLVADGGLELHLPVPPGYDWSAVRGFLAVRAIPGVEAVNGDTYRRTITVHDAPGLLEISPSDGDQLLLRAHLPYWGRLTHIVDRVGQLLGCATDHTTGVAALSADPVLGPIVRERPGLAVPGAWDLLEIGVRAILNSGNDLQSASRWLTTIVAELGTPVPGLPGNLTHTFPAPRALTVDRLAAIGLPTTDVAAIAALAAAVPTNDIIANGAIDMLVLKAVDLYPELAFRLGQREAFPLTDPALRAGLANLGVHPSTTDPAVAPEFSRWRRWLPLAAVHLMAHGDRLAVAQQSPR